MPTRVRNTRSAQRSRYYAKHRKHAKNAYQRWTADEERGVMERSECDVKLSLKLGRSVQAIQEKRCKINQEEQ